MSGARNKHTITLSIKCRPRLKQVIPDVKVKP